MNPGVYGPLDSATNLYIGLPINKQRVSTCSVTLAVFTVPTVFADFTVFTMLAMLTDFTFFTVFTIFPVFMVFTNFGSSYKL